MSMTPLPAPPSTSDPTSFATKADALLAALPQFVTEANALGTGLNFPGLMANSATSVAIGTGSKSFTVDTGKTFVAGMSLFIQYTTTPTNWMYGTVTSYNSGTGALVVNVTGVLGSGTYALWTVSLGEPLVSSLGFSMAGLLNHAVGADIASAATLNLSTATGNTVHVTGTAATSAVTMNAGQWIRCIANGAWPLTYHVTNNRLNGGVSYTCAAGDIVDYFYDGTTIYGNITKFDGTAVVAPVATAGEVTTGTNNTKMVTPLAAQALVPTVATGTLKVAQSAAVVGTATSMSNLVEFYIPKTGTISTTMYIKATSSNPTITGRIYKNGAAVGINRTTTLNSYQAFSENIAVTKGDLIQLYGMTSNGAFSYDEYLTLFEAAPTTYIQTV